MTHSLSKIADAIASSVKDARQQAGWEEALWEEIQWCDGLDTKQVDIVFGMVVSRWDAAAVLAHARQRAADERAEASRRVIP